MDQLTAARIHLVQLYQAHPQGWPDGIDTKYDRWYSTNKAYWDELARVTKSRSSVTKTPVTVTESPDIVTESTPETVTKTPDIVTETTVTETPVTKIPSVTKTVKEVVTRLKQVGRPKKDKTVSAAERAKEYRQRRKQNADTR